MSDTIINAAPTLVSSDHDLLIRIDQRVLQLFNSFDTFRLDTMTELKDHERRLGLVEDFPKNWDADRRCKEHDELYNDYRTRQTGWKITSGGWKGLVNILGFIALLVGLILNSRLLKW